jgi:hypothetical protein
MAFHFTARIQCPFVISFLLFFAITDSFVKVWKQYTDIMQVDVYETYCANIWNWNTDFGSYAAINMHHTRVGAASKK